LRPAGGGKIANDVSARETLIKYPTPQLFYLPGHTCPSCALIKEAASFVISFVIFFRWGGKLIKNILPGGACFG